MCNPNIISIKETIEDLKNDNSIPTSTGYSMLHKILTIFCKEMLGQENPYCNNLNDLIKTLKKKNLITSEVAEILQCIRIDTENVLDLTSSPDEEMYRLAIDTINGIITKNTENSAAAKYTELWRNKHILKTKQKKIKRIRCTFVRHEDNCIVVIPDEDPTMHEIKVRPQKHNNDYTFHNTVACIEEGMKLNIVDAVFENGILIPDIIVLEPDYLMDISTVADCIKEYGTHPANYYLRLLTDTEQRMPLILGNIVNLFLDEWIYSPCAPDYMNTMKKVFKKHALELITCPEIDNNERAFFDTCHMHFENLRKTVYGIFTQKEYGLNTDDAVLEPSYICETLGLQGRLDYMQRDMSCFIEMKSGKADEFSNRGNIEALLSNKVQMMLYLATLQYNMDMNHNNTKAYLLYTRYPHLYTSTPSWEMVRNAIDARNRIVSCEYSMHRHNSAQYTEEVIKEVSPDIINEKRVNNRLWTNYIQPQISKIQKQINSLDNIEKAYFMSLFTFIGNELYLSKTGNGEYDRNSSSSVWDMTLTEKEDRGIVINNMNIIENHIADIHAPYIIFSLPPLKENSVLNFRNGDLVIVYECNTPNDRATNKMVFKGNIEEIDNKTARIRFRSPQRNPKIIDETSLFSLEPDYSDKPTLSMFSSLNNFVKANKDRINLILGKREPEFDKEMLEKAEKETDDFGRIAAKSIAAKDMMLIIGPPGTGKTSFALKQIVERHLENGKSNILLLSYTNRAVDEICKSISRINPEIDFIRLGSELACDEKYRSYLLENRLKNCTRRSEARETINKCNIFVSTVVTLQNKPEIFRLKQFDCAIIDESTQILEPQILGILTAKTPNEENAIKKFIMIGDNKQLPAVTLQNDKDAEIKHEELIKSGFKTFKESLFERLFRYYSPKEHPCVDMLCKQGRMHEDIADFSNKYFYHNRLLIAGLEHQTERIHTESEENIKSFSDIIDKRIAFIPSTSDSKNLNDKTNKDEAKIAAELAYHIYIKNKKDFNIDKTVGIIAPYKNQIALIRQELAAKDIDILKNITIDTVERYQGSERDYIIFTFCINKPYQISMMSNTIEENGQIIDRKLNVALTRARKYLFITGNPEILKTNFVYNCLIGYMKEKKYFINR